MKKLYLSLLWHQHQPYYKNDSDGRFYMPWVYLHALKDYYEMAAHVEKSGVKAVFNYVPSLLIQLKEYTDFNAADNFLILMRKQVASLTREERQLVLNQCCMANLHTMIKPIKRFYELHQKVVASNGNAADFSDAEILDLEVVYILSWCGEYLRQQDGHIQYLISKGSSFTEEDKIELLKHAADWVSKIVEIHKRLQANNQAEISCTPFYHPILPLLIDINSAKEVCPDMNMPVFEGNLEDDAAWHVREGLNEFERHFGFRPKGMWPAEGSVSQKAAEMFAGNGISWIATDEEVLGNSLQINMKDGANRYRLYQKHFQIHNGQKINIFFRDKMLSDLIGFTYSSWNEDDAVNDFMHHLRNIYDSVDFSPHVSVILDGENAWEYYNQNAYNFFTKLYDRLTHTDWLQTQTFSEVINNYDVPEETLHNIKAGSWIMGNFRIWIGHPEKNKAWELLSKTKRSIEKHISNADEAAAAQIYKEYHAAEGSDWFWWYGDDHFSIQADVFDKLFRTHLVNIYRLLKLNVPSELFTPIKATKNSGVITKPSSYVCPKIEGKISNFFEWLGAGEFDLKSDAGSMHAGGDTLQHMLYGFDDKNLYFALKSDFSSLEDTVCQIDVSFDDNKKTFEIDLECKKSTSGDVTYAIDHILEASIPLKLFKGAEKIFLEFKQVKNGLVIEKAPLYNAVEINIADDFKEEWIV